MDAEAAARHAREPEVQILEVPNWRRRGGGSGLGLVIRMRIRGGGNKTAAPAAASDASMGLCGCVLACAFALFAAVQEVGAKKFTKCSGNYNRIYLLLSSIFFFGEHVLRRKECYNNICEF